MAQDLTASALTRLQAMISSMFTDGRSTYLMDRDRNANQALTAAALMENQSANMRLLNDPSGTCRGIEIFNLEDQMVKGDGNLETFASEDCDLPADNGPLSAGTEYDHNLRIEQTFYVDDDDCDNLFNNPAAFKEGRVTEIVADQILLGFKNLRSQLNDEFVTFLGASATGVNRDVNLPSYITFNAVTRQYEVSLAGFFQNPQSLTDIDALVSNNDMYDYFLHSGRYNFYNNVVDSQFLRLNDDQRSLARWSSALSAPLTFDINRLDSGLTGKNTFAIMPGSYAAWNVQLFPTVRRTGSERDGLYEISIPDPILRIRDERGQIRPVYYNLTYQYECKGFDKNGRSTYQHKWVARYLGGLALAPPAKDDHTGILWLVDNSGI
jgi:hypothetical protein